MFGSPRALPCSAPSGSRMRGPVTAQDGWRCSSRVSCAMAPGSNRQSGFMISASGACATASAWLTARPNPTLCAFRISRGVRLELQRDLGAAVGGRVVDDHGLPRRVADVVGNRLQRQAQLRAGVVVHDHCGHAWRHRDPLGQLELERLLAPLERQPPAFEQRPDVARGGPRVALNQCALAQHAAQPGQRRSLGLQERAQPTGAREVGGSRKVVEQVARQRPQQDPARRVLEIHPLEVALGMEDGKGADVAQRGAAAVPHHRAGNVADPVAAQPRPVGQVHVLVRDEEILVEPVQLLEHLPRHQAGTAAGGEHFTRFGRRAPPARRDGA